MEIKQGSNSRRAAVEVIITDFTVSTVASETSFIVHVSKYSVIICINLTYEYVFNMSLVCLYRLL